MHQSELKCEGIYEDILPSDTSTIENVINELDFDVGRIK